MQTTPAQTLMLWIITAHLFIAIVAYEWLPATYRGGWILIIGEDIIDDANAMFDYINSFSNENIELESISRLAK